MPEPFRYACTYLSNDFFFHPRQEHRFAVAGGIGEKPDNIEGLVFLGDNVCAASLVIPETVTEKDTVLEQVSRVSLYSAHCRLEINLSY